MTQSNSILDNDWLTPAEVAKFRGVERQTVYQWIKNGMPVQIDRIGRKFVSRAVAKRYQPRPQGRPPGRKNHKRSKQPKEKR